MMRYAKVVNEESGLCQVGTGSKTAFYEKIGMVLMDVAQATDGQWYLADRVPAETPEQQAQAARARRNDLLAEADVLIAIAEDAKVSSDALRQYRQALRDLPQQAGFPAEIAWPVKPGEEQAAGADVPVPTDAAVVQGKGVPTVLAEAIFSDVADVAGEDVPADAAPVPAVDVAPAAAAAVSNEAIMQFLSAVQLHMQSQQS